MREFTGATIFALLFYLMFAFILGSFEWPITLWHLENGGGIRFITLLVFILWLTLGSVAFL